jgi:hypothetical protein
MGAGRERRVVEGIELRGGGGVALKRGFFLGEETDDLFFGVFEHEVNAGDEDESNGGGEEDAEAEGDGHRDEEFGLHIGFEEHGGQAGEGGERSEDNGAEAAGAGFADGVDDAFAIVAVAVHVIDEDETVVHDNAGEGDDAAHGHDTEFGAHDDVSEDGADDAEGDDGHDDDGLNVGTKGNGHEDIHDDEGDEHAGTDFGNRLVLILLFALKDEGDAGEFFFGLQEGAYLRQDGLYAEDAADPVCEITDRNFHGGLGIQALGDGGDDFVGVGAGGFVDIGGDGDGAAAIGAFDGGV